MTALFALRGNKEVAEALLKSVKIKTKACGCVLALSHMCVCVYPGCILLPVPLPLLLLPLILWLLPVPVPLPLLLLPLSHNYAYNSPGHCCCNYVAGCKTNCQQRRRTRASKKTKESNASCARTKTTVLPGRTQTRAPEQNKRHFLQKMLYLFKIFKTLFPKQTLSCYV